jgi:hypothetical protein
MSLNLPHSVQPCSGVVFEHQMSYKTNKKRVKHTKLVQLKLIVIAVPHSPSTFTTSEGNSEF